ncbi:MAG: transposase domain-containing protein [Rhodospirillaceae bacterium]|nr:transposase domain-containing protein [Rhodospirillaceae bacterium]
MSSYTTFTLIETAKLNGVDPQACLRNILACIADTRLPNQLCHFSQPARKLHFRKLLELKGTFPFSFLAAGPHEAKPAAV